MACNADARPHVYVAWCPQFYAPTAIPSLSGKGVKSLGAGQHHSIALTGREVISFGNKNYGGLGRELPDDEASEAGLPGAILSSAFEGVAVQVTYPCCWDARTTVRPSRVPSTLMPCLRVHATA